MMVTSEYNIGTVVVGAGIIGVAIARELALRGREVLVLEQETRLGQHQSNRNSGVVHAGFYYPEGSVKARLCHEAKLDLYRFAAERGVPHCRVGKIVVAADEGQLPMLETMRRRAEACGVRDIALMTAAEVRGIEPDIACVGGLWSPSTGIIDTTALLLAIRAEAEALGVSFAVASQVVGAARVGDRWRVSVRSAGEETTIICVLLVNSAGLEACNVARSFEGCPAERIPDSYLARGNFFACHGGVPFTHLVYPLPGPIGLGVHLTLDLDGQAKFGPDVELVETISYEVKPERAAGLYESIRGFWPGIKEGSLVPAYSGIRAKIGKPGAPQDWIIDTPSEHGVPGLVNLFGMETPGMTCSMAIGREIATRVKKGAFA